MEWRVYREGGSSKDTYLFSLDVGKRGEHEAYQNGI